MAPDAGGDVPWAAEVDAAPWQAGTDDYLDGGLLGAYVHGEAESLVDVGLALSPTHLHPTLDLTDERGVFASLLAAGPFYGRVRGGLRVDETGPYQLALLADDSAELRIDGIPVVHFWNTGEATTESVVLVLAKGWHDLEVIYASHPYRAQLRLWMAPVGESLALVTSAETGYAQEPPEALGELEGTVDVAETWLYGARLHYTANAPSRLTAVATLTDETSFEVTSDSMATEGWVPLALVPGTTTVLAAAITDVWGRSQVVDPVEVSTPSIPSYTPGAILGSYHEGKAFQTLVATRLDSVLNFPDSALDGGAGGNFGIDMTPNVFSVRWDGGLYIETPGTYTLHWGTDDGQRITLDGVLLAEYWQGHGLEYVSPTVELSQGWHPLVLEMYENYGGAAARFEWEGPGILRATVPAQFLGSVPPEDDGEDPELLDLEVVPGETEGVAILSFHGSELSIAAVTVIQGGDQQILAFTDYATSFHYVFTEKPEGDTSLVVALTDRFGNKSLIDTVSVYVPGPPPPEEEDP